MLPAGNRLRRRQDFATAVRRGRRAGRPTLVVHVQVTGQVIGQFTDPVSDPARVGFVVGRTVGSAVVRNLVKRRLRHLVRSRLGRLPDGALIVIRALPPAATASSAELAADLDASLDHAFGTAPSREGADS